MTAPTFAPSTEQRRERLLATIQRVGGEWTAVRVRRLYTEQRIDSRRSTASGDLQDLAARGFLVQRDRHGRRSYTLNTATGGTR